MNRKGVRDDEGGEMTKEKETKLRARMRMICTKHDVQKPTSNKKREDARRKGKGETMRRRSGRKKWNVMNSANDEGVNVNGSHQGRRGRRQI